jgi:hypothetical protein
MDFYLGRLSKYGIPTESNKQKKNNNNFVLASRKLLTKIKCTDPRIRIRFQNVTDPERCFLMPVYVLEPTVKEKTEGKNTV